MATDPTAQPLSEAAPASPPARPTRAEWLRIAIFGIPYAAFFLVGVPTSLFPASWNLTAINLAIDTVLLIVVLAFFADYRSRTWCLSSGFRLGLRAKVAVI